MDWSEIEDNAARYENVIASHLLKFVDFLKEYEGYEAQLWFLRASDNREVDFLVTINRKPWFCVEAKLKETKISRHLLYFKSRLKIPFAYQVIKKKEIDFIKDEVRVVAVDRFLSSLV